MKFLIVDNLYQYPDASQKIQPLLDCMKALDIEYEVKNADHSIDVAKLNQYDGVILSGGPWDLTKPLLLGYYKLNTQVLQQANLAILAICMGHQITAESNGAKIGKEKKHSNGFYEIQLQETDNPLFNGMPSHFKMRESHQEFVQTIPSGFILAATSPSDCHIQSLRSTEKGRCIYTTQFHPELSGDLGLQLLKNFKIIAKAYKLQQVDGNEQKMSEPVALVSIKQNNNVLFTNKLPHPNQDVLDKNDHDKTCLPCIIL